MMSITKAANKIGPLLALISVFSLFAILGGQKFCQLGTLNDILMLSVICGVAAVGATLIIISGGIDLSVGCTIAIVTVVIAKILNVKFGEEYIVVMHPILWPLFAIFIGIICGALIGCIIGASVVGHVGRVVAVLMGLLSIYWIANSGISIYIAVLIGIAVGVILWKINDLTIGKTPLPPFIVTLGLWASLRGTAKWIADESAVYPDVTSINKHSIWIYSIMSDIKIGNYILPMPGVWIWFFLAIIIFLMLKFTRFGRHLYAIGSNVNTARLCGINVSKTMIIAYAIAIACAGLAGVLRFAWLGMGDPTADMGTELLVIAAVVIGGASLSGGVGSIGGTIIGTLIIMIVYKGCTVLELKNFVQEIVTGGIIVAAVTLDQLRKRKAFNK